MVVLFCICLGFLLGLYIMAWLSARTYRKLFKDTVRSWKKEQETVRNSMEASSKLTDTLVRQRTKLTNACEGFRDLTRELMRPALYETCPGVYAEVKKAHCLALDAIESIFDPIRPKAEPPKEVITEGGSPRVPRRGERYIIADSQLEVEEHTGKLPPRDGHKVTLKPDTKLFLDAIDWEESV